MLIIGRISDSHVSLPSQAPVGSYNIGSNLLASSRTLPSDCVRGQPCPVPYSLPTLELWRLTFWRYVISRYLSALMRLLKFKNDTEFSLTDDLIDDTSPYAILSHRWGLDTDEVTFRDLIDGTGTGKAGYDKIRFCGEQAKRDGLQFFWVDTCCIDKSNSSELQEAINSMFRWYGEAAKCYVYLSDVSVPNPENSNQTSTSTWELAFRNSRWFTRGWTLQELIAPVSVEFF